MTSTTRGVQFPLSPKGVRSTTDVAQQVVADALRTQRADWADEALTERDWRGGYLLHFRRLLEAGLSSAQAWGAVADAGLTSARSRMVTVAEDSSERPVPDLLTSGPTRKLRTVAVSGTGTPAPLTVAYRGTSLTGSALVEQLERWATAGVLEPSAAHAVQAVVEHPEWLSLPGRTVAVLGAGSEMGPARSLLSWGATVAAVDRPNAAMWSSLIAQAADSAGTLLVPVLDDAPLDNEPELLADHAGGCLLSDVPELATWLGDLTDAPVLGNYTYADGGTHVQLSIAADLLGQRLRQQRPDTALAFLATPTDTFAVPRDAVDHARDRHVARSRTSKALRSLTAGRLLAPAYDFWGTEDIVAVNDALVAVQGPNYAFAKRLQRWSATVARNEGTTVSLNVAPATRTRSVTKNRALAAAYAGAHRFGLDIFEPETTNALMTALLVHDLAAPAATAQPASWHDEAIGAVHGGLWRAAYQPRSVLNIAAVLGAPKVLR